MLWSIQKESNSNGGWFISFKIVHDLTSQMLLLNQWICVHGPIHGKFNENRSKIFKRAIIALYLTNQFNRVTIETKKPIHLYFWISALCSLVYIAVVSHAISFRKFSMPCHAIPSHTILYYYRLTKFRLFFVNRPLIKIRSWDGIFVLFVCRSNEYCWNRDW